MLQLSHWHVLGVQHVAASFLQAVQPIMHALHLAVIVAALSAGCKVRLGLQWEVQVTRCTRSLVASSTRPRVAPGQS